MTLRADLVVFVRAFRVRLCDDVLLVITFSVNRKVLTFSQ